MTVASANVKEEYTFHDMVDIYTQNSPEVKIATIELDMVKLDYEDKVEQVKNNERNKNKAKSDYDNSKNSSSSTKIKDKKEIYYDNYIGWASSIKGLEDAKFKLEHKDQLYDNKVKTLVYDFEQQLWQYYDLQSQYDLLEQTTHYYKKLYDVAMTQYELELVTELDVLKAKNQYLFNEMNLKALQGNLNNLKENILIEAGINKVDPVKFIFDNPEPIEPIDISINLLSNGYNKKSIDNKKQDGLLQSEINYVNLLKEEFSDKDEDYIEATLNLEKAELNRYEYDQHIKMILIQEYYNYKNSVDQFNTAQSSYQISKRQQAESKLAYEAGKLSEIEFEGTQVDFKKAETDYYKAVINYNLAIRRLELIFSGINLQ